MFVIADRKLPHQVIETSSSVQLEQLSLVDSYVI